MSTSAKRLSLSNPIVIAVVLVLLAVVTVVNIKTFAPKRKTIRRAADAGTEISSVPLDLEQVVRRAAAAGPVGGGGGGLDAPTLNRDPFARPRRTASGAAPEQPVKAEPARVNPDTLICAAVLPGGDSPVARVNGRTLRIGDTIRGWSLSGIETGGVRLSRADGRSLFLAVSSGRESNKSYRMVTGVQDPDDPGRTSLDKETERRSP